MRSCTSSRPSATIFFGVSADLEQPPRRLVDAGVGRLRRQHHGHEQGVGVDVLQLALGLRVGGGKAPEDLLDALRRRPRPARLWRARFALGRGVGPGLTALGIRASRAPTALVGSPDMNGNTQQTQAEPGAFHAVLTPYRSLGPSGFLILMIALGAMSFVDRRRLSHRGRLAGAGLLRPRRPARLRRLQAQLPRRAACTRPSTSRRHSSTWTRVHPSGRQEQFDCNPYWARVNSARVAGRAHRCSASLPRARNWPLPAS